jgi:hypothetical protein
MRLDLVIPPKSARPREAGGLDEGAPEILRGAQDDTTPGCHPERREGSRAGFWGITRLDGLTLAYNAFYTEQTFLY